MKKNLFSIILFFSSLSFNFAQQWTILGNAGFANSYSPNPFIAVNKNGIPYVAFRSYPGPTVMKFEANTWDTIGIKGFGGGDLYCQTMVFDKNDTPYVVYTDVGNTYKATVKKFNGNNWVTVGIAGFTPSGASFTSIALDSSGTPYVAFRDLNYQYRASVMKFDGVNWVYVGSPGFSLLNGCCYGASYTTISFDRYNTPYVAYSDDANGNRATVQKFDGTNWVNVGSAGYKNWNASYTRSMVFDKNATPYLICSISNKATVVKFDGNNWITVGSSVSNGYTEYASIAIDTNDIIYVAFKDVANGNKATVMKFDGTNWLTVGAVGFTSADFAYLTSAVTPNGIVYVSFQDCATPSCGYSTVMKYENNVLKINENENKGLFNVYPNPSGSTFKIQYENKEATGNLRIDIKDINGKSVYIESINNFNGKLDKQINLHNLSKGVYFVGLSSEKLHEIKKIIIE